MKPCFELLVMSALDFKASVDSLTCTLCHRSMLRLFTQHTCTCAIIGDHSTYYCVCSTVKYTSAQEVHK